MTTKYEMSQEAKKILEFVETTSPGQQFTHDFVRNLTGVNDVARLRGYIYTAFRHAFKRSGMKFRPVRGIGYERLGESGNNAEVSRQIVSVSRRTKRTEKLHKSVEFHVLDALGKLEHVVNGTQIAEMRKAASRKARNKIAEVADQNGTVQAAISGTLELFKRKRA